MNLIDTLRDVGRDTLSEFSTINWGGCCVYAAVVAAWLQEHDITTWGLVADKKQSPSAVDSARPKDPLFVSNWNDNGITFFHVMVQFEHEGKVWTHDTESTIDNELECKAVTQFSNKICPGYLEVAELVSLASDSHWNSQFDRSLIPSVAKRVWRNLELGHRKGLAF